ncbi:MAG: hypothetical protein ACRBM6_20530 [Geminicoccales bacterium]
MDSKGHLGLPFLQIVDRYLLEPLVKRMYPEPRARRVGVRVLREGASGCRILCLAGAFCGDTAANWSDWIADLGERFTEAEIVVVNGFYYYWPEEAEVMQEIIAEGRTLLADGRPTVIVSFSFGGLLAKAMVDEAEHHSVRAIVTMATEHRGHLPRIAETRDVRLGIPLDVDVPIVSFGGWLDMVVWPWTTFTDRSQHHFLIAGHFAFMRSRAVRSKVITVLDDIVFRNQCA